MQRIGRCLYLELYCELQSYSQPSLLGGTPSHMPYERKSFGLKNTFIHYLHYPLGSAFYIAKSLPLCKQTAQQSDPQT